MNESAIEWPILRLYELISGPAEHERPWDEVQDLFYPGARLRLNVQNDDDTYQHLDVTVHEFTEQAAEHYRKRGFWEREIARQVQHFGNIGHVFSTYESRVDGPDTEPVARGINSVQMFRYDGKWRITSVVFHIERKRLTIPSRYLR